MVYILFLWPLYTYVTRQLQHIEHRINCYLKLYKDFVLIGNFNAEIFETNFGYFCAAH